MELQKQLTKYLELSSPLLEKVYHQQSQTAETVGRLPAELMDDLFAHARKGKKLRGFLTILGYKLGGGEVDERILKVSLVPELFHAGALVEDDVMDKSMVRRGREAIHAKYGRRGGENFGIGMAICAADAAYYLSWQVLFSAGFDEKETVRAGQVYAKHAVKLMYGQVLDVGAGGGNKLNQEEIMKISWIKSGDYSCWFPLRLGLTLAGNSNIELEEAAAKYAESLGWVFQLRDDWLGTFGNNKTTGKPVVDDLREGKQTLLVWHLRKYGSKQQVKYLESILGRETTGEIGADRIKKIYEAAGSKQYIENQISRRVETGRQAVKKIAAAREIKQVLEEMLKYMAARNK